MNLISIALSIAEVLQGGLAAFDNHCGQIRSISGLAVMLDSLQIQLFSLSLSSTYIYLAFLAPLSAVP